MSKSTPYLKRADNGVWYVHWTENRIGKRLSSGTKDEIAARTFLAQVIVANGEVATKGLAARTAMTLADVWKVYDEKHVRVKLASQDTAIQVWRQLEPHFGAMPASGLTQDAVDGYLTKRTSGKLGRKVKPQTVLKELAYMMAAVKFCADERRGVIPPDYARKLTLPDPGAARTRWLRTEEIQKLMEAAARMRRGKRMTRGERYLWLALETAGRKQALLDLEWDRVDFETNTIQLDVPGRRKTKKRRPAVPISDALRPVLQRMHKERINDLVLDNKAPVWATIQLIAIEAGLGNGAVKVPHSQKPKSTGISPHVFRHTAATHMVRRGVPLYQVAAILGNSVQMVANVYGHHAKDDLRNAVNTISGGALKPAE